MSFKDFFPWYPIKQYANIGLDDGLNRTNHWRIYALLGLDRRKGLVIQERFVFGGM